MKNHLQNILQIIIDTVEYLEHKCSAVWHLVTDILLNQLKEIIRKGGEML